jgi:HprK-related kinase A
VRRVYGEFRFAGDAPFSDFHVQVSGGNGLRRWLRPQVRFTIDGVEPFEPFPRESVLALYEWGVNWCFSQRFNQYLLFHAGVVAIDDRAIILAATPGSGKSTLSAALMLSGFRLLSDEFGVLDPQAGTLQAMLKPIALKNRSIEIIRNLARGACFGPTNAGTRKGDVAHLAPDAASVAAVGRPARPALIVFPSWKEGAPLKLARQPPEQAFIRLAFNSFNYALLGSVSFNAAADVASICPAYELAYGHLEDAIVAIRELLYSPVSMSA